MNWMQQHRQTLIATIHYGVILFAFSLPFWVHWKLVIVLVLSYHLLITKGLGYCPLTRWQYGTAKEGFIEKHLVSLCTHFHLPLPRRSHLQWMIRYGIPLAIIALTLFWQHR